MVSNGAESVPPHIACRRFLLDGLRPGMRVLDVGCGDGNLLKELVDLGCHASGVEIDPQLVATCRRDGLEVTEGRAERLPIEAESVDAIVCSVVLPYTDEKLAIAEWARVLRPGGLANFTCHGVGYGIDFLLFSRGWRRRLYGGRMLINTAIYATTGRKPRNPFGDTLCQTSRRLRSYYGPLHLILLAEQVAGTALRSPRFLCHRVAKAAAR